MVLSRGGGAVLKAENRRLIRRKADVVVWTRSGAEAVCRRLKGTSARPLLNVGDRMRAVRRLLKKRTPLYRKLADVSFDSGPGGPALKRSFERLVRRIVTEKKT